MKKILCLLIIFFFSTSIFAQFGDLGGLGEGEIEGITLEEIQSNPEFYDQSTGTYDIGAIIEDPEIEPQSLLPLLQEEEFVENVSFESSFTEMGIDFTDENNEQVVAIKETITEELEKMDYSVDEIEAAITVAEELSTGKTLKTIKEENPEQFEVFEVALVATISEQVSGQIITPEMEESITGALDMVASVTDVLKGFAQATANTSMAATQFGYQGYDLFAVSFGIIGSAAVSDPVTNALYFLNNQDVDILEELKTRGITAGVSVQGFAASVGLNMNWLSDGLYLNAVFGSTTTTLDSVSGGKVSVLGIDVYTEVPELDLGEGMPAINSTLSTAVYGVKASYQLIDAVGIPILFRWNGITATTGFIYNEFNLTNSLDLSPALGIEKETLGGNLDILSQAYTIPLEISTGIRLLSMLNISIGGGVDFNFGSSNMVFDMTFGDPDSIISKAIKKTINDLVASGGSGLTFPLDIAGEPALINPRINLGVGAGLGPVSVDVFVALYPMTGVSFGVNFVLRI